MSSAYGIREAEQNMVFSARLTQHGHTVRNMEDLMTLYHQAYSKKTVENIASLPHPTVQKFMVITIAIVGANQTLGWRYIFVLLVPVLIITLISIRLCSLQEL